METNETLLRCPQCGSEQFINAGYPDFHSEITCEACGARNVVKTIAISTAIRKGDLKLAAQLSSTTFGGVGGQ